MKMAAYRFILEAANKALRTNHRPALGFGLSFGYSTLVSIITLSSGRLLESLVVSMS